MKFEIDKPIAPRDDRKLLPLVNIVFLLLVFILLAGTITSPERLAVRLPVSSTENPALAPDLKITLLDDGAVLLDGQPVDPGALGRALQAFSHASPAGRIRIIADQQSLSGDLLDLLEQLSAYGFEQVRLIVQRAGR